MLEENYRIGFGNHRPKIPDDFNVVMKKIKGHINKICPLPSFLRASKKSFFVDCRLLHRPCQAIFENFEVKVVCLKSYLWFWVNSGTVMTQIKILASK